MRASTAGAARIDRPALDTCLRGIGLHNAFRITQRNPGLVGIAAVDQKLDARASLRSDIAAEIARDHDPDQYAVLVDGALDPRVGTCKPLDVEIARSLKLARQRAADSRAVLVVNQSRDFVDVQAQSISVKQQHHKRHRKRKRQTAGISRDVVQLFQEDCPRAPVAHAVFLSSASIRATKTSSSEG